MLNPNEVRRAAQDVVVEMTGKRVRDADSLISSGLIDSLSILRLIGSLENRLSAAIPAGDLQPDDFESVNSITDTVLRVAQPR
jgi:acyl carrier protein